MKKILLSLAILCCSIGAWADDAVTAKVSGTSLNIALTNSVEYVAFQMDITMPSDASVSAVAAVASRLTQTGSDTEIGGTKFIVAYNDITESGETATKTYRVIAYNLNNDAIAGTSGDDILNITLSAAPSASSDITVSNIIFVKKDDLSKATLADVTGEDGYKMGDVNHDGVVNVDDLTAVVKYICEKNPSPFYPAQANVATSSSDINVDDLTGIISIIKQDN